MAHSIANGHNACGPDTSDKAAALRGASLAFQKKRESSTLEPPGQTKLQRQASNGALTAATISAQSTGSSAVGLPDMDHWTAKGVVMARLQQLGTQQQQQQQQNQSQFLRPQSRGVDTKSPSFIAATLAASRSGSPTAKVRTPRRRISVGTASTSDAVDSEHIPPTNSLISMFERGKGELVKATLLSHDPVERAPRSGETASRSAETARLLEYAFPEEKAARRQSRDKRSAPSPDRTAEPPRNAPKKNPPPAVPPAKPSQVVKQASTTSTPDPRQLATLPQQPAVTKKPDEPPPRETKPAKPAAPLSQKKTAVPKMTNRYNSPPAVESSRSPRSQMIITEQPEVLSPKPKRLSRPNLGPPASPIRTPGKGVPTVEMSPGDPQKKQTPIKPKPSVRQPPNNVDRNSPRPEPDVSAVKPQPPTPPKPREPKPRHANAKPQGSPIPITKSMRKDTSGTASSNDAFYSAPTSPSEELPSPPPRRMLSVTATPSPAGDRRRRHSVTPSSTSNTNMSLGSLTSAIMAGSLAASRLTPTNTGSSLHAATPRRQKSPHLKQTLRQPLGADVDEDDKHKRGHHHKFTKPRHTHHEGARKRWRDEVRPRERKRYEAVWASNRGLLLPSANPSPPPSVARGGAPPLPQPPGLDYKECVANVVVREIWRRSRLPEDELAEVWDLVDRAGVGMLTRQEFIVGMWLIDQCLKGRKTPQKVTNSVWGSTGSAGSANVKIKGPRPKGCD